ncbi:MAG: Rne/Rng family ribonuclease [Micromonosporaceae bacterium]
MLDYESAGGDQPDAGPAGVTDENTTAPTRRGRRRTKATATGNGAPASGAPADGSPTPAEPAAATQPAEPSRRRRKAVVAAQGDDTGESRTESDKTADTPPRSRRRSARSASTEPAPPALAGPAPADLSQAAAAQPAKARRTKAQPVKAQPATTQPATTQQPATTPPATTPPAKAGRTRRTRAATTGSGEGTAAAVEPTPAAGVPVPAAAAGGEPAVESAGPEPAQSRRRGSALPPTTAVFFVAPAQTPEPARTRPVSPAPPPAEAEGTEAGRSRRRRARRAAEPVEAPPAVVEPVDEDEDVEADDGAAGRRRRRGRRGRGRGKGTIEGGDEAATTELEAPEAPEEDAGDEEPLTRRRRHRRRRGSGEADATAADGVVTVVRIREPRSGRDEVQGVTGSTRLEAKRQRRRDGRDQRRTRPPILSESEFLARREAVDRVMVIRERGDRTQIAVLEDGILVEHYVARQSASTMVGNVYLGKVQNVLPSMEAAFVDIGRGRNAVLYAGEVNWDASGLEGRARSIEQALRSGDSVLVQVTKDPIGHKGARLTSHVALSGRHLVYVPHGNASGISRKLSDVERRRLRDVLKSLVPEGAGVIVRTAAEGAAEDDLARDVKRLQAQWEDIQRKAADGGAPVLLYSEPDLVIRVVRDLFNEDFREVVIQGDDAHDEVEDYLGHVSPDLVARVRRHTGVADAFAEWRVDEQILKGLDRKVYLPSGGHLVIDRTEAMTVIDVNTGKYTGAGGNLEETVTRNNLEAAEEIVRQLRLRDLGGIIVIDFIDMVLESNRELVLRRLTECLGRDRTKHQVTEITSLGLVQMTRKRIGQGLLEAFSEVCEHCKGRGVVIHTEPVPERSRESGIAEKVRAVAASSRSGGAQRDLTEQELTEQELTERDADESEAPEPTADPVVELEAGGESDGEPSVPVRRRARRGGTRRRTRP